MGEERAGHCISLKRRTERKSAREREGQTQSYLGEEKGKEKGKEKRKLQSLSEIDNGYIFEHCSLSPFPLLLHCFLFLYEPPPQLPYQLTRFDLHQRPFVVRRSFEVFHYVQNREGANKGHGPSGLLQQKAMNQTL